MILPRNEGYGGGEKRNTKLSRGRGKKKENKNEPAASEGGGMKRLYADSGKKERHRGPQGGEKKRKGEFVLPQGIYLEEKVAPADTYTQ